MAKYNFEEVKKEVKKMISGIIEVPEENLQEDISFAEDLGVDSMMALEIIASLEKKYKIIVPEEKIPTVRNLKNVYALLEEIMRK